MKIYHTSTLEIVYPDILHSREGLDFGTGFYATALIDQAVAYGQKYTFKGQAAVLNEYELDDKYVECNLKQFNLYDEEWLDFIMANRSMIPDVIQYDIIEGGVADDKIFRTIDLYLAGDISKSAALKRLKYEKPNHQICFRTQIVIDRYLRFLSSRIL